MESHAIKPHSSSEVEVRHPETLHEVSTVQVKPVVVFAIILIVTALASFATVKILLDYMNFNFAKVDTPASPLAPSEQIPPLPHLQVSSGQDLIELRSKEAALLHGYRWISKDAGTVGIPVERAIELLAQRGLPAREGSKPAQ